jgi:hypothetical protein
MQIKFAFFDSIPCSVVDKIVSEKPTALVFSMEELCYFENGERNFLRNAGCYLPKYICHIPRDCYLNAHGQENLKSDTQTFGGQTSTRVS